MIQSEWQRLKFEKALYVPFSSQGPEGGPDAGYIVPRPNSRGNPLYDENRHGPIKGRDGIHHYQCFCPECGQAPLTLVDKFKAAGSAEPDPYFRTVTGPHQLSHTADCPLQVLEHDGTPSSEIDWSRSPTLALNIRKAVLGRVDRRKVVSGLTQTVVHWDRVSKKYIYDEPLRNCERFRAKSVSDLVLATSIMPEYRLSGMKLIYEGRATPWSHVNVGKLAAGRHYIEEGKFDPLDTLIRNLAHDVQYPVLLHVSLYPSRGKEIDGRLRFSLDDVQIYEKKTGGDTVRKADIIPLIHVRDPELFQKFREGGEFTILAVPHTNRSGDGRKIFLNIDVRDASVVSDLGADGFANKLGSTPKRDPRPKVEETLVEEKPIEPISNVRQMGLDAMFADAGRGNATPDLRASRKTRSLKSVSVPEEPPVQAKLLGF